MFRKSFYLSFFLSLATTSFAGSSSAPVTATVGTCAGASPYTTISAAVTAVPAGSTVRVCPGIYPEQVLIAKSLTLTGLSAGTAQNPTIVSPSGGLVTNSAKLRNGLTQAVQIFVTKAASVNISNLTVDGSNNAIAGCGVDPVGIKYQLSSGVISHVVVKNQALSSPGLIGCQSGEGIIAESVSTMSGSSVVSVTSSSVHGYQKNGIVGDGSNTKLTVQSNFVTGQGPTTGAAENGIEFISGATGLISGNLVSDHIYSPATAGASGILIYASQGVIITGNSVADSQYGVATASDSTLPNPGNANGTADKTSVLLNAVTNAAFDGVDACSNSNIITGNLIVNAQESGIHLDSTCTGTGKSNIVTANTINEACAGVLLGATPNTLTSNTTFNVSNVTLAGDSCPVVPVATNLLALVSPAPAATHVPTSPF